MGLGGGSDRETGSVLRWFGDAVEWKDWWIARPGVGVCV